MKSENASNHLLDTMHAALHAVILIVLAFLLALPLAVAAAGPKSFATADEAVNALLAALKADDDSALIAIFGDEHADLLITPDKAANSAVRGKAVAAMQTYRLLEEYGKDQLELLIGDQAWPFPIPLVKDAERWHFATDQGVDELVNRRVGANELGAIGVLQAYVDAQREYASRDRSGDGVFQYAQRLASTKGKRDGLYWPADAAMGEETSPFGPLVAESTAYLEGRRAGDPYRGYHFRILTRQGKSAPGGAYSYLINGRMIAGFAMVAYPARYGESGVMTFIVSQSGKVFEKDLGTNSAAAGAKMTIFDPGTGWHEVVR
jgi:hypothetical protein